MKEEIIFGCELNKPDLEEVYHSRKGTKWKNHKYIAIKNGRYIYPSRGKSQTRKVVSNPINDAYEEYEEDKEERNENAKNNVRYYLSNVQKWIKSTDFGKFMNTPIKDTFKLTKKAYAKEEDKKKKKEK